jgi:hypothetical protein
MSSICASLARAEGLAEGGDKEPRRQTKRFTERAVRASEKEWITHFFVCGKFGSSLLEGLGFFFEGKR